MTADERCQRLAPASIQRLDDSDFWLGVIYCHEPHIVGPDALDVVHGAIQEHATFNPEATGDPGGAR